MCRISQRWSASLFFSLSFSASVSSSVRAICRGRRSAWPTGVFFSMSWWGLDRQGTHYTHWWWPTFNQYLFMVFINTCSVLLCTQILIYNRINVDYKCWYHVNRCWTYLCLKYSRFCPRISARDKGICKDKIRGDFPLKVWFTCLVLPLLVKVHIAPSHVYSALQWELTRIIFEPNLKEQNELREPLDGFHHQAIQSHSVTAGVLAMLKKRRRVTG